MGQNKKRTHASLLSTYESKRAYLKKLLSDSDQYDLGDPMRDEIALDISGKLRNLLLDRGRQISLLTQLDMKSELYFESKMNPLSGANNIYPDWPLLSTLSSSKGLMFKSNHEITNGIKYDFFSWWNEIVIDSKEDNNNLITRKEIVVVLADKEEAHTDPNYETKYNIICNNNGLKLYQDSNGVIRLPGNNPYKECVFTIARELLDALAFREIVLRFPNRRIRLDPIRYISTEYIIGENDRGEKVLGFRNKRWLTGETEYAYMNIISFDIKSSVRRLYGRCSQVLLSTSPNGDVNAFPLIAMSNQCFHIHFFFDINAQIFMIFYEDNGQYRVISGSRIGKQNKLDPVYIRIAFENHILNRDVEFSSYESMLVECGIPPGLENK